MSIYIKVFQSKNQAVVFDMVMKRREIRIYSVQQKQKNLNDIPLPLSPTFLGGRAVLACMFLIP